MIQKVLEAMAAEQKRFRIVQEINIVDGKTSFYKLYERYCETHIKPRTKKIESYNRYFSTLEATKGYFYDSLIMDIRSVSGFYQ